MTVKTIYSNCFILILLVIRSFTLASSGEDGRKSLMREIELGKLLGENPQPNIVTFIGCVTTQGKHLKDPGQLCLRFCLHASVSVAHFTWSVIK